MEKSQHTGFTRLDAFEMKGLRKILRFYSQQIKQTSGFLQSWSKEGTARHCQNKEASKLWSHHEETSCLEKEIIQGTMPGARRRARSRTAWMDNINTLAGLPVESQSE